MYCRKCGKELQEDWKLCPNCGTPVYDTGKEKNSIEEDEKAGKESRKKIWRKWQFWMCTVLFIVIVSVIIIITLENKKKQETDIAIEETESINQVKAEKEPVTDFSDQDFSTLLGKTEADLGNSGLIENEDTGEYSALEGNLLVKIKDGEVNEIIITGDEKTAPVFDSVALGTTGDEAKTRLTPDYPESQDITDGFKLLNLDTKGSVECTVEDDKVSSIRYAQLSDEEIEAFRTDKEEKLRAEYIFPDSDKKYLSEDEIRSKTVDEMMIGRNEIFARHGYIFDDENLKQHFEGTSWYKGTIPAEQFDSDQTFNDFERKNVELIKQVEDEINGVAKAEAEQQNAINEGYDFLVGNSYNLRGWQLVIEFQSSDTVRVCYGGEILDDYFDYSITARYEENKGEMSWLKYININGVEYYLRCFTDGSINLSGPGDFDGWYDLV
mgnify:CR=1 FL=1